MTLVLTANVVGQPRGEPVTLPNRRRRLSTIVARHRPPPGRNFIVSVHRRGVVDQRPMQPCDATARLRADWSKTLIGPQDAVLITVLPGRGGIASIGLSIASIALIALAPYAAPLIAGSLLFGGGAAAGALTTAIQVGMVVGGIGLSFAAQASSAAKTRERTLYSVSGGGNVPKPSGRKPLIYGKCWTNPPLSQRDYFRYDGDTMVLTKRLTLGLGRFQINEVRVGDATFWKEGQGLVAPFNQTAAGVDASSQTAIEFLYEQASTIAVGDAISSGQVSGQDLPRFDGNPSTTPWFRLTPQGVTASSALISRTYPQVYVIGSSSGQQKSNVAGAVWIARRIDPTTGAVIGQEFELLREDLGRVLITTGLRKSSVVRLPAEGAYEVRAYNLYTDPKEKGQNRVTWDELTAFKDDVRIRPKTTEIAMRVRAGPGLTVTAFSDITVLATRILPVWNGSAWVEQATRKAVWAFADLVRANYGLALDAGADAEKARYYANLLTSADTFDGALPEVSSFWEAASTALLPMRADPIKVGAVHSFVRDEPQDAPRHVISRRQMVRDSGTAIFKAKVEGSDVIVEFDREGDPKRPDEVRYSYGPATRTPKRYRVAGITDGAHALKHAKWLAACATFRGAERSVTTEWSGRLVYPGDRILSDMWFLKSAAAYGVSSANSNVLTLDCDANVDPIVWSYGSVRTRTGKAWGILRVRGQGKRGLELHSDDLAQLSSSTGLSLADVLARDSQQPTTVVVGALAEMQQTWVARSAIPSDDDNVQIEMVRDDPRVWQIIDETPIVPAPIGVNPLDEPLIPTISSLFARCEQIETGIQVVWSVSLTLGARNFKADLSYDAGKTWEPLSPLGPASSGRAPLRQSLDPISVRVCAFGRTGLVGPYVTTTFLTMAPAVDGSLVDINTLAPIKRSNLDALLADATDTTAPGIPVGLVPTSALNVSPTGVVTTTASLTWTAVTDAKLANYEVSVAQVPFPSASDFVGGDIVGTNSWSRGGFPPGTTVALKVRSISKNGYPSAWSEPVSFTTALNTVPPNPVTGLTATAAFETAFLAWTNPTNSDLGYVEIWAGATNALSGATKLATVGASTTTFTDTTLGTTATRYYWARPFNTSKIGATNYTGPVSATSAALAAAQLAAGIVDATKIAASLAVSQIFPNPPTSNVGAYVTISNDGNKLYRWNGSAYTKVVDASDVGVGLTAAQIASVNAAAVAGTLSDAQLAAISAAKITGQVTSTQITDRAITTVKIAAQAVTASEILANTITAGQIAAATITATQIAARTIAAANLVAGTITANEIASRTITAANVVAGTLTGNEIQANSITAGQIQAGAIGATQIAAEAITTSKLAIQSRNIAYNPDLSQGLRGYSAPTGSVSGITGLTIDPIAFSPSGFSSVSFQIVNTASAIASGYAEFTNYSVDASGTAVRYKVTAGVTYEFSACMAAPRCRGRLYVNWFKPDGTSAGVSDTATTVVNNYSSGGPYKSFPKSQMIVIAPTGAVTATVSFRADQVSGDYPLLYVSGFMFAATTQPAGSLETSPYVAPGGTFIDGGNVFTNSLNASAIVARSITADRILAGAITANEIAAAAITAGKLAADSVVAGNVAAGAITARHIYLSDSTNMLSNGDFLDNTFNGWGAPSGNSFIQTFEATNPGGYRQLRNDTTQEALRSLAIMCSPGDDIYASCMVQNTRSGGNAFLLIQFQDGNGGFIQNAFIGQTALKNTWVRLESTAKVPAGSQRMYLIVFADNPGAPCYFGRMQLRRATGASLVVEGSISGSKLAVGINSNNLLQNSNGLSDTKNFSSGFNDWGAVVTPETNPFSSDWAPQGFRAAYVNATGQPASGKAFDIIYRYRKVDGSWTDRVPVTPGQRYEFSAITSNHRCQSTAYLNFFDASGNSLGIGGYPTPSGSNQVGSSSPFSAFTQNAYFVIAPANAVTAQLIVRGITTGENIPYLFTTAWYFAAALPNQTAFSVYAPSGGGTVIENGNIATSSITADRLAVASLSAINANLGSITAGRMQSSDGKMDINLNSVYIAMSD